LSPTWGKKQASPENGFELEPYNRMAYGRWLDQRGSTNTPVLPPAKAVRAE